MVVHVADLAQCSATDLQRVMRRAVRDTGYCPPEPVTLNEPVMFAVPKSPWAVEVPLPMTTLPIAVWKKFGALRQVTEKYHC